MKFEFADASNSTVVEKHTPRPKQKRADWRVLKSTDIIPLNKRQWFDRLELDTTWPSKMVKLIRALLVAEAEIQKGIVPQAMAKWELEKVDRYYYYTNSFLTETAYREVSFWYKADTLERKETSRQHFCLKGEEHKLSDWCKSIYDRRRSLEVH